MQRFVSATAARDERHLAGAGCPGSLDEGRIQRNLEQIGVGHRHPFQRFSHHCVGLIDEFFHGKSSQGGRWLSGGMKGESGDRVTADFGPASGAGILGGGGGPAPVADAILCFRRAHFPS